ncbi:MAG: deoxyhypusine synthase [Deltaproteobacteria bacterium HGW-Deltaproteobacteria-14]|jgi:deoxyhypusine synthase|nr:MAG: deoxyhypusine synthase [Deltaproteobacteria bacterium HGW-Deltaproteobacteria-14]
MPAVRDFMENHFLHFNSRELVAAARAYEAHIDAGGKMMVTLAGAMSTARLGRILSRMIRAGKVHAISCTGANLEEDVFTLLACDEYETIQDWRALSAADEAALLERGMNRVTDTCIPETVMRHIEKRLHRRWTDATERGVTLRPSEFMMDVLGEPDIAQHFQAPTTDSWLLAAKEMGVPVYTPGWEDSTTGNMFAAFVFREGLSGHGCVATGTAQMEQLMRWYLANCGDGVSHPSVGFFQVGGGIAGDFAICAVPALIQDLSMDIPLWGYFAQISDAVTSYGGYSGAVPNEKITWGKLHVDTPKFMVQSDATICAPLLFAYVLKD